MRTVVSYGDHLDICRVREKYNSMPVVIEPILEAMDQVLCM